MTPAACTSHAPVLHLSRAKAAAARPLRVLDGVLGVEVSQARQDLQDNHREELITRIVQHA